jgi:hypothetical protein
MLKISRATFYGYLQVGGEVSSHEVVENEMASLPTKFTANPRISVGTSTPFS